MSVDLRIIGVLVVWIIVLYALDDPQTRGWLEARWSAVGRTFRKRRERIRIGGPPHENCRRDVNTGSWT